MKKPLFIFLNMIFLFCYENFVMASEPSEEIKPYRVYIKPQSILNKINGNEGFVTTRGVYAYVIDRDFYKKDKMLVFDKKGNPIYEVDSEDVVLFDKDIALYPNPKADTRYPIAQTYQATNKNLYLNTEFNIHFDQIKTTKFSEINNQENEDAVGNRFEIKSKVLSLFPVDFGVTFNYESSTWSSNFTDVALDIFSFGPFLQKTFYEENNFQALVSFGAEVAPIYRVQSLGINDHFNGLLLDFGLDGTWETQYGKWSLGTHYRRHDMTLNNTENKVQPFAPSNFIINSYGFMIGYTYAWKL